MADTPNLDRYPHGATVTFADEHCLAAPGVHSATWMDARDATTHEFLTTLVHPDIDDPCDDDIAVTPDRNVWCLWDSDTGWYGEDLVFVVPHLEQLSREQLDELHVAAAAAETTVECRDGWSNALVEQTMNSWAAANGRPDLTFRYDADYRSPVIDEVNARIAAVEAGEVDTYEIAPGITVAGPAFDELLEGGIDEAATVTAKLVETFGPLARCHPDA